MKLQVYRGEDIISTFDIDEGTVFSEKLQNSRTITCPVAVKDALILLDGDYIVHNGETYRINNLPDFTKDGSKLQKEYNITFEAEFYWLLDTLVLNSLGHDVFPMYGSAVDHLNMIFSNANRNGAGWTVGEVSATEGFNIDYNNTYVRTALDMIAEPAKLEWSFNGRAIIMVSQLGVDTGLTFEVGRGKGLHQISRTQDNSKSIVTRAFGVGGSTNIDYTYRGGIEPNLIFEGRYVETPGVTAGTERAREAKYVNEDIYPRFNGSITGVSVIMDAEDKITSVIITDTAIDFDINAHLQEGIPAKVSFRTGPLTGKNFEIASYNAITKAIELIPVADTNGYLLPNDLNLPAAGNKFTLIDMRMPDAYKVAAELELRNATLQYLNDNKQARLLFNVKPDQKYLRENAIVLKVGDRATVVEPDADVDEILRFTEISYPLVNEFDVTAVVGNEIRYDRVVKLFADTLQTRKDVQTIDRRSAELAKRGVMDLRAFEDSVFDTDGKFDSDKFNVGVLTAILGIFGAKSQNFKLNGVYITDNYGADNTKVFISGGELIHFEISNASDQNIWTMTSLLADTPVLASLYYVYARCSRTAQVGSWVVTMDQIKPEDEAGYYHFLTGVVYPVIAGWRNSDFTNGIADINGNRLKIGKILSRDGLTGFDLDASTIFGRITFAAGSAGYNNIIDKPDLSQFATQQFVDAIKDELQGQIDGSITTWFYAYEPTLANAPANTWVIDEQKNAQLGDLFYDTVTGYAYRFQVSAGVYSWVKITDTDITLALAKAQEAQDTADGKRRVFTTTPTTPYDVGDLWSQGTGGDLMRCYTARAVGSYVASDWDKASKYTDDTAANIVQGNLNALSAGLGGMAYEDVVELAKLGTTIIQGGYIKSDLIEVSTLIVQGGLETTAGAQAKADAARIAAEAAAALDASAKANQAINYADAKAYSSGRILYRDIEFREGFNGINVYNNAQNGTVVIDRLTRDAWGEGTALSLPTTSTHGLRVRNSGPASPGLGGFFFGTGTRANAKYVTRIIAIIPVGATINWASNAFGNGGTNFWATSQAGTGLWTEYINVTKCGTSGTFASTNFFYLEGTEGTEWYVASATVYDVTDSEVDYIKDAQAKADAALASANATAATIAQSKADIAQANAISIASGDATGKANAAYTNALSAAQTYATTVANAAATQAEINAAADALNKANQAYLDAVANATSQYNALTASLGAMAYQNVVELAKLGSTIIQNGMIVTTLLDAAYIKANIVNAAYITALNIVAKTLAADAGTIGGWQITPSGIKDETGGGYLLSNIGYGGGGVTKAAIGLIAASSANPEAPGSFSTYYASKFESTSVRGAGSTNTAIYAVASGADINRAVHAVATTGSAIYAEGTIEQASGNFFTQGNITAVGFLQIGGGVKCTGIGGVSGDRPLRIDASGQIYRG